MLFGCFFFSIYSSKQTTFRCLRLFLLQLRHRRLMCSLLWERACTSDESQIMQVTASKQKRADEWNG